MTSPFRQEALKRLANPEELDRTLSVTTSRGWIAAAAMMAMAVAVIVWSFKGEVSTYVPSQGILLNSGGAIVDAVATGAGNLTSISVEVGDTVEEGQAIGETANFETMERYRSALDLIEEREAALADLKAALAREDAAIAQNVARQRGRLEELERSGRQSIGTARQRLDDHTRLFEENVVTRLTVERSQQAFDRAQRDLFNTMRQLDDLEAREIQRKNENDARISEAEARLQAAERQANELDALIETQRVLAPVAGAVTEIKATVGAVLRPGTPLVSIETGERRLELLMYLPSAEGKRVEPGMEVLVSPNTVRREEHGSLRGVVENVSAFPASLDSIVATLQNRELAQSVAASGPPYAGRVSFVPDPATESGFAWTSPKAASQTVTAGTLATAEVKVSGRAPITLVVPLIKEALGL